MQSYQSWGRFPHAEQEIRPLYWRSDRLPFGDLTGTVLPYGLGRSYGDVCLNDGHAVMPTAHLERLISFDRQNGIIACESGISLATLLDVIVPAGWFLPVTPGTRFVTLGGAVANDVHGKNHHKAGTVGRHVRSFELCRSDGTRVVCSPDSSAELYAATIGGLGLTGLITWVELQLIPISSRQIQVRTIKMANLDEFFRLSTECEDAYDYTVAWIDCLARGRSLGRGLFMCGNHLPGSSDGDLKASRAAGGLLSVPFDMPGFVLNGFTVRVFNCLYYHRQWRDEVVKSVDLQPFFYPLDSVLNWNRIYGKAGLLQYQCVVPYDDSSIIRSILETISDARQGSFLAVLKVLGDVPSPGVLSFPRPGVTLTLDFPVRGERTFSLFRRLDAIVRDAGGRLYPAKDACMSADDFQGYYPNWREFARYIDPKFSSSFWRRVTGQR